MNRSTSQALLLDALYQVLDNKVFRLLFAMVLVFVLPTFLIGAREDRLVILLGWREYYYEDVFAWLDLPYPGLEQAHELLIQLVQQLFVDRFVGTFGLTFCIAATAFFVPRMLEKGAADALFTKPVGRFTLLASRYAAGLIFVGLLAVLLVGGMHLGLLLNSGYSDPGFLWSIPILIYVFAILHAFSVLVGVLTRSTVAAILTTMIFFLFTSCTHVVWSAVQREQEQRAAELAAAATSELPDAEAFDRAAAFFTRAVAVAHYVLPKTNDAPLIAAKLRQGMSGDPWAYRDAELDLTVLDEPQGFELRSQDVTGAGVLWVLPASTPEGEVHLRLRRQARAGALGEHEQLRGPDFARHISGLVAEELRSELAADPAVRDLAIERNPNGIWRQSDTWPASERKIADYSTAWLAGERAGRAFEIAIFSRLPNWVYELRVEAPQAWLASPEGRRIVQGFQASFVFDYQDPAEQPRSDFEKRFDWRAPLPYNIFFSLGSSLAFVGLLLAVAGWRLARIDF